MTAFLRIHRRHPGTRIGAVAALAVLALASTVESSAGLGAAGGGLDSSFGSAGKRVVDVGDDYAAGGVLQSDGKIVATGIADSDGSDAQLLFVRLDANGALDSTFSADGIGAVTVAGTAGAVLVATAPAVAPNGSYIAGVWEYTETEAATMSPLIAKFTAAGAPDTSFDGDGFATLDALPGTQDWILEVAVDASNRILALVIDEQGHSAVVRMTATGALDTSFDGDGIHEAAAGENYATFLPTADGKLLVGGGRAGAADEFAVWRLTSAGAADSGWGSSGRVTKSSSKTGRYHVVTALATDAHGRVVAGGDTFIKTDPYSGEGWIMRFTPGGAADGEFGSGGIVQHTGSVGNDGIRDVGVQANGRIAVLGTTDEGSVGVFGVTRYLQDGRLDTNFGTSGTTKVDFHSGAEDAYMWSLFVDSSDRIVAVGDILGTGAAQTSDIAFARLDGSGYIDVIAYTPGVLGGVNVAAGDVDGDGTAEVITVPASRGGPHVRILEPDGYAGPQWFAFTPGFTGGVDVAAGDVDGDGKAEVITAAGLGGGPHVRIWKVSGSSVSELTGFFAYTSGFTGGVNVATGDIDGDGKAEIITAPKSGGGPHVRVLKVSGSKVTELTGFFAYTPGFTGGVSVAAGDIDGDGKAEVFTGAGPGGGPHVRVIEIRDGAPVAKVDAFAYTPGFRAGVEVAGGDTDANGKAEVITAPGYGGGPHVRVFDATTWTERYGFMAYSATFAGGVHVDAGDVGGNGHVEVVTGPGLGGTPQVRGFDVSP